MDYIKEIKTENLLQHVLTDSVGVIQFYHLENAIITHTRLDLALKKIAMWNTFMFLLSLFCQLIWGQLFFS